MHCLIKIKTKKFRHEKRDIFSSRYIKVKLIDAKSRFSAQNWSNISDISINSRHFGAKDWRNVYGKFQRLDSIKVSSVNPALIVPGRHSIRMWETTHASHVTVTPSTWRVLDQVGGEQCDVARIAGPLTLSCCFGGGCCVRSEPNSVNPETVPPPLNYILPPSDV